MFTKRAIWPWAGLLAHLPGVALAAVTFTNPDYYIEAGAPFTITWTNNRGAVAITLMNGPDADLQPVLVLVSDYEGEAYTWTPPSTLPTDSYELRIEDSGSVDYSPRFRFAGASGVGTSTQSTGQTASASATSTLQVPVPLTITGPSSGSVTSTLSISHGTPTVTSTTPTEPAPPSGTESDPLSTAAKAGIGIAGGILSVALLSALLWFAYRRGMQRAAAAAAGGTAGRGSNRDGGGGGAGGGEDNELHQELVGIKTAAAGAYTSNPTTTTVSVNNGASPSNSKLGATEAQAESGLEDGGYDARPPRVELPVLTRGGWDDMGSTSSTGGGGSWGMWKGLGGGGAWGERVELDSMGRGSGKGFAKHSGNGSVRSGSFSRLPGEEVGWESAGKRGHWGGFGHERKEGLAELPADLER